MLQSSNKKNKNNKNKNILAKMDIILAVILLVLIIHFFNPQLSDTVGYAFQSINEEPQCAFFNNEITNSVPIALCCAELQKQLACDKSADENYDFKCYTSKSANYYYLINDAAEYYCKKEGYLVKTA
ncbi:hypothetical protein HZA96_00605 [Candidatus Woesearchaeota archaeon]|nr:hypothetical protein [Candidatus Woesearchaeota archaeon]